MKSYWLYCFLIFIVACAGGSLRKTASSHHSNFSDSEAMTIARLRKEAFSRCQSPFKAPVIEPVLILDPPQSGGAAAVGMVYQEELAVKTSNLLDRDDFYFSPRPRAAVNSLPMELFIDDEKKGIYTRKTWEDANPDYSSENILPPIKKSEIPLAGRVLTELIIGHRAPDGGYPQLFDIRSSAYLRFAGYPPQITGASLRLGAHRVFSLGAPGESNVKEDFPIIRAMFATVKDKRTANALVLIESDLFCGALSLDFVEGAKAEMLVDGYWYTREDFQWKKDPHTGFVAYSSMSWKTEKHTPERDSDEAHDTDTFVVRYADGSQEKRSVESPELKLRITDFTKKAASHKQPVEWILANEDRDPGHYADFKPALGHTNYDQRASYKVTILESNIKTGVSLYEQQPEGEYGDNIVAMSTIRQNIKKSDNANKYTHFKYRTLAFFP